MPARVVVVLDDGQLCAEVADILSKSGYEALAMPDSMVALDALEGAALIELLVASINFSGGKPNGVSLALMARIRRPKLNVIFLGSPDYAQYSTGLGEIIPTPASASEIVQHAIQLLGNPALPQR
jgi:DNA-binding response OmpR family regulator